MLHGMPRVERDGAFSLLLFFIPRTAEGVAHWR